MQPPSGGCVLKQRSVGKVQLKTCAAAFGRLCVETMLLCRHSKRCLQQPPSGGCVLKHLLKRLNHQSREQPPSGGCVLKLHHQDYRKHFLNAAAFGRLCVETLFFLLIQSLFMAAAFGRLCVETSNPLIAVDLPVRSRLRAAVC